MITSYHIGSLGFLLFLMGPCVLVMLWNDLIAPRINARKPGAFKPPVRSRR